MKQWGMAECHLAPLWSTKTKLYITRNISSVILLSLSSLNLPPILCDHWYCLQKHRDSQFILISFFVVFSVVRLCVIYIFFYLMREAWLVWWLAFDLTIHQDPVSLLQYWPPSFRALCIASGYPGQTLPCFACHWLWLWKSKKEKQSNNKKTLIDWPRAVRLEADHWQKSLLKILSFIWPRIRMFIYVVYRD